MKFLEQIERINRLHELIKHRRTGTPQQLAERLQLSTSMVYKLMEELRLHEAPIEYSRQLGTYYYSKEYQMKIQIDFRFLRKEEEASYRGGSKPSLYTARGTHFYPDFTLNKLLFLLTILLVY